MNTKSALLVCYAIDSNSGWRLHQSKAVIDG